MVKTIGITGKNGFIGWHLFHTLSLYKKEFSLIDFKRDYFNNIDELVNFVNKCDVIIHLAGVNRYHDQTTLYDTNVKLAKALITAVTKSNKKPHIIFASSTQEERDTIYGQSKREGRLLLAQWAKANAIPFTGLIIPNVFGPFGKPFYNSVVSTFCYQLINHEAPKVDKDAVLNFIYVSELINDLINLIRQELGQSREKYIIQHTSVLTVSQLFEKLREFTTKYLVTGEIPQLDNMLDINLFNTFRSHIDLKKHFPFMYKINADQRGLFVEIAKVNSGGQMSFSTTKANITRGNHFHMRKIERFMVIKGEALMQLRKIGDNEKIELKLSGNSPSFVDVPIWYAHNITNIGQEDLYIIFWVNEFYDPVDPDTFIEQV